MISARVACLIGIALVAVAPSSSSARAEISAGRFVGLVEIPAMNDLIIAGKDTYARTLRVPIVLRAQPHAASAVVAELRTRDGIETLEHSYEESSALVDSMRHDKDGTWYEVRYLVGGRRGTAWLSPQSAGSYRSIYQLFEVRRLTYLTRDWDQKLYPAPEHDSPNTVTRSQDRPSAPVASMETRNGEIWMLVVVIRESFCAGPGADLSVIASGWVPLFSPNGKLMVWYYSRGC